MTDWIDMFRKREGLAGRHFKVSDLEELDVIARKYRKKARAGRKMEIRNKNSILEV